VKKSLNAAAARASHTAPGIALPTLRAPYRGARSAPALGVGVVSRQVVDAAIDVAYETDRDILLIASRRQVDDGLLGSGYVEGWTTRSFARYVRARDRERRVKLCRDHGGPWQHPREFGQLDEQAVLESAFTSLKADVDEGFDVIHIDTSVDVSGEPSSDVAATRLVTLYERVARYARQVGRYVEFEISVERQKSSVEQAAQFRRDLNSVIAELDSRGLPLPRFVVAQTGTKVVEMRNVGEIMRRSRARRVFARLRALVAVSEKYGVCVKAHNCDYLDVAGWELLARSGIAAANVAPEYGVVQTKAFVQLLRVHGHDAAAGRFMELAYRSQRWRKWLDVESSATPYQCAVLAGHYIFSEPEIITLRSSLDGPKSRGRSLDDLLRNVVKRVIRGHLDHFVAAIQ
jgi:D-tagatose-1,6-bisphosphate aldolase subunit GatZ/KbaZ-like